MNKHLLFIIIVVLLNTCKQSPAHKAGVVKTDIMAKGVKLLPVRKMQADLTILWSAIKEMHPAYGIYISADNLQVVYHDVNASLNKPLTESDYITHMYPLLCEGLAAGTLSCTTLPGISHQALSCPICPLKY